MEPTLFFMAGFVALFTFMTKDFDLSILISGIVSLLVSVYLLKDWTSIMGIGGIVMAAIGGFLHFRGH